MFSKFKINGKVRYLKLLEVKIIVYFYEYTWHQKPTAAAVRELSVILHCSEKKLFSVARKMQNAGLIP